MLANNPEISRLAALGRLYDPLPSDKALEMALLLQTTDDKKDLPDWLKVHLKVTEVRQEQEQKNLASVEKHQLGGHDQSRHANRKVAGVPEYVDLDGKRWNEDSVRELGSRVNAYKQTRQEAFDKAAGEDFDGRKWEELEPSERTAELAESYWEKADKDPSVIAAKEVVTSHFIYAEAAALSSADGGKIGDKDFTDPNSPLERLTRISSVQAGNNADNIELMSQQGDRELARLSQENATVFPDPNVAVDISGTNLTKEKALEIASDDYAEFLATSEPQIVMSASNVQKVASSERVKNVFETTRPSRSGANDNEYLDQRKTYESVAFGYTDATPLDKRPVYGLLSNDEPYTEFLDIYGGRNPAVVRLKSTVKERTTFTEDDSLNSLLTPSPLNQAPIMPWSAEAAKVAVYREATGRNWYVDNKINAPEVQVHGGVSLDDISGVTFYGSPSATTIATMDRKNIPYTIEEATGTGGLSSD